MTQKDRALLAAAAQDYFDGKRSWESFQNEFGQVACEVVDMIEHEPQRGGMFGVNTADWNRYRQGLKKAIEKLKADSGDS